MHWHDSFSVGVHLIDGHHQRLFGLINELIIASETQQELRVIGRVFESVVDYAKMHFRAEEELFREQPDFEAHRAEHLAFEEHLVRFQTEHPLDQPGSAPRLLRHLTDWLRHHILMIDIGTFSQIGFRLREPREAIQERLQLLTHKPTVLIVEDLPTQRLFLRKCLEADDFLVIEAANAQEALELLDTTLDVHLVVTDIHMPGGTGFELIRAIRERQLPSIYIVVVTELRDKEALVESFRLGANDFLSKPIYPQELLLRLRNGLNLIRMESQDELIFGMANLADCRSPETGRHLERVQIFTRLLGRQLSQSHPELGLNDSIINDIAKYSPLHDIGKVAIADAILNKPGKLTEEEFVLMQEHARIGGNLLGGILRKTGSRSLSLAYDLTMHHHERWDGSGYPAGLSGEDIPIAARIMALADVYDALTNARVYKPAFSREAAVGIIQKSSGSHFDPTLVDVFTHLEERFHQIRQELQD